MTSTAGPEDIGKIASRVESYVRSTSFFLRLSDGVFNRMDSDHRGAVPMLKMTLAIPILFQRFQGSLFDRFGENNCKLSGKLLHGGGSFIRVPLPSCAHAGIKIGCPTYEETVKLLLEADRFVILNNLPYELLCSKEA